MTLGANRLTLSTSTMCIHPSIVKYGIRLPGLRPIDAAPNGDVVRDGFDWTHTLRDTPASESQRANPSQCRSGNERELLEAEAIGNG